MLFLLTSVYLCACGSDEVHGEADTDDSDEVGSDVYDATTDSYSDVESDADDDVSDGDPDVVEDSPEEVVVFPPVEEVPACGNRVLEEGEECDDGNRINGDGCDWLCNLGDGDPPPSPDPDVVDYEPSGDPVSLPDAIPHTISFERLPLVWTGSEYASVWATRPEGSLPAEIEFRRFGIDGLTIDSPWRYEAPAYSGGMDLVWTGSGFGLFYVDINVGLFYMRLDDKGKPLSSPVLIEADPSARAPAADLASGGFVVAWIQDMSGLPGWSRCSGTDEDIAKMVMIGLDGSITSPLVIVDETAQGSPDVATGENGFGLVFPVSDEFDPIGPNCGFRFFRVDDSLTSGTSSGILGRFQDGEVKWSDDHWVTAWSACSPCSSDPFGGYIAVAHFAADGTLVSPPVMNAATDETDRTAVRIAAGDGGLALVWTFSGSYLEYLRTDSAGVEVGPVHDVVDHDSSTDYGAYAIAWSNDAFGILFHQEEPEPAGLYLRHFVAIE